MEHGRVAGARPSRPLASYAGTYVDSLFGPVVVRQEADKLTMKMGDGLTADLVPWHYDAFMVCWRS